jgi:hypothetical protein
MKEWRCIQVGHHDELAKQLWNGNNKDGNYTLTIQPEWGELIITL